MLKTRAFHRTLRFRCLSAAVSCLLTLCGAEAAVRLLTLDLPLGNTVAPHPRWHHWHEPGGRHAHFNVETQTSVPILFNNAGQRDSRQLPQARPENTYRLAVLGDSFIEALQVPEEASVARRLEGHVAAHGAVEVLNFGCSGFSPLLEEVLLREEVLRWDPQQVICFYHATDITDDWLFARKAVYDEQGRIRAVPGGYHPGQQLRDVLHQSCLYRLALRAFPSAPASAAPTEVTLKNSIQAIVHEPYLADDEEAWAHSLAALRRMAETCRARGVGFLVVVIPLGPQVEPVDAATAESLRGLVEPGQRLVSTSFQQRLLDYCGRHEIACLDLLPGFRAANPGGQPLLILPRNQHWTEAGHDLAARLVAAKIGGPLVPPGSRP